GVEEDGDGYRGGDGDAPARRVTESGRRPDRPAAPPHDAPHPGHQGDKGDGLEDDHPSGVPREAVDPRPVAGVEEAHEKAVGAPDVEAAHADHRAPVADDPAE